MDYLEKYQKNPTDNLSWNLPTETPQGSFAIIGGSSSSFRTSVKITEFVSNFVNLKELKTVLPDSLKSKLPPLENLIFLKSTDTGSFKDPDELKSVIESADSSLIIGDLSKNSVTKKAVESAEVSSREPLFVTRDAVDLIADSAAEKLLMRPDFTIMGSIVQWQKILHAIYYPKMLMPSQSLVQVAEVFHKFTLSYPARIVTFHDGQILVVENGRVALVPLEKTTYSPLTLWSGELAAKIAIMSLFNPDRFIEATISAIFLPN